MKQPFFTRTSPAYGDDESQTSSNNESQTSSKWPLTPLPPEPTPNNPPSATRIAAIFAVLLCCWPRTRRG